MARGSDAPDRRPPGARERPAGSRRKRVEGGNRRVPTTRGTRASPDRGGSGRGRTLARVALPRGGLGPRSARRETRPARGTRVDRARAAQPPVGAPSARSWNRCWEHSRSRPATIVEPRSRPKHRARTRSRPPNRDTARVDAGPGRAARDRPRSPTGRAPSDGALGARARPARRSHSMGEQPCSSRLRWYSSKD